MKKSNQKGFMLTETLIVSTFIVSVLLFIYVQLRNINANYADSLAYNDVTTIYSASNIKNFLLEDNYEELKQYFKDNFSLDPDAPLVYLDLTTCPASVVNETTYCQALLEQLNIKKVIFTDESNEYLLRFLDNDNNLSNNMKQFIKSQKTDGEIGEYRLYVETNDGKFATIKMKLPGEGQIVEKPLLPEIEKNLCTTDKTTECYKTEGNEYVYTGASGTVGNNWLWYGGHSWRIIKVDKTTNKYTLITSYPVTAISWQSSVANGPSLEESYVGDWLNNVFVASLSIDVQSKLENMTYTRKVYNGSSVVEEEISNVKVRLLTENEYTTYGGANSYLDIKDYYWLADIYSSSYVRYVFGSGSGNVDFNSPFYTYGVRAIVEISDITITEGDGTLTDLYIGNTSKATNVSDIAVGEYISVPQSDGGTYLARVVKHDQNGTKVILNGLYNTSSFGSDTTFSTSSTIYTGALTEFKNSLDSNYFDSTNRDFNMTIYPDGANYADTTTMFNGNIGLPSVGEMLSGNDIDLGGTKVFVDTSKILNSTISIYYWLMNASSSSSVSYLNYNGYLKDGSSSDTNGVRATWYIKNTKITGGNGTANDPYTLSQ